MDKLIFSGKAIDSQLSEIISAGGRICLVVTGSSMLPFLKHGRDMVCLRAWEENDIKRGQILLFSGRINLLFFTASASAFRTESF